MFPSATSGGRLASLRTHCSRVLPVKSVRKPAIAWRDVDGILLLDKPSGVSSNHALQAVRRLFRAAKAGHTGSLDPLATGLLPICFGESTKIAGLLIGSSKAYSTTAMLGQTRSTDDAEGELLIERHIPTIDDDLIRRGLATLTGEQTQIPPIYSAIKRDGERMYTRARRGEVVDVPSRTVQVDRFELIANNLPTLDLEIECGSGTYVRSLVRDLGEFLACGAHVTALRRLWVDPFRDPAMLTLDQLETLAGQGVSALDETLLSVEAGLAHFTQCRVDAENELRLRKGQGIEAVVAKGFCVAVSAESGRVVALAESDGTGRIKPTRGFSAES